MNNNKLDNKSTMPTTAGIRFYGIEEVCALTGWSEMTVQKLFKDPNFPSADYGKAKLIEESALRDFFSVRHEKDRESYWRNRDLCR